MTATRELEAWYVLPSQPSCLLQSPFTALGEHVAKHLHGRVVSHTGTCVLYAADRRGLEAQGRWRLAKLGLPSHLGQSGHYSNPVDADLGIVSSSKTNEVRSRHMALQLIASRQAILDTIT